MHCSLLSLLLLLPLAGLAGKLHESSTSHSRHARNLQIRNSTYALQDIYQGQSFLKYVVGSLSPWIPHTQPTAMIVIGCFSPLMIPPMDSLAFKPKKMLYRKNLLLFKLMVQLSWPSTTSPRFHQVVNAIRELFEDRRPPLACEI